MWLCADTAERLFDILHSGTAVQIISPPHEPFVGLYTMHNSPQDVVNSWRLHCLCLQGRLRFQLDPLEPLCPSLSCQFYDPSHPPWQ